MQYYIFTYINLYYINYYVNLIFKIIAQHNIILRTMFIVYILYIHLVVYFSEVYEQILYGTHRRNSRQLVCTFLGDNRAEQVTCVLL